MGKNKGKHYKALCYTEKDPFENAFLSETMISLF